MEYVMKSKRARVCVNKSVYPRVTIQINDIVLINKSENYNVTYVKRGGNQRRGPEGFPGTSGSAGAGSGGPDGKSCGSALRRSAAGFDAADGNP